MIQVHTRTVITIGAGFRRRIIFNSKHGVQVSVVWCGLDERVVLQEAVVAATILLFKDRERERERENEREGELYIHSQGKTDEKLQFHIDPPHGHNHGLCFSGHWIIGFEHGSDGIRHDQ